MKKLVTGLLLVSLLLGAVACAQSASVPKDSYYSGMEAPPAPTIMVAPNHVPAPASSPGSIFGGRGEATTTTVITVPQTVPTTKPVPAEAESGQPWAGERMVVRTGNIMLVVVDVSKAMEQIAGLAGSFDGYVVSSNSWKEGERLMGNIAIRVSAEHFDAAIGALRGMAVEVTSESTSGQDVTEEYIDLSAKLSNLEASEQQLLKLMEQAGDVSEILDVQRELTSTRGEIEQTKGRMQYLEQTAAMSLIQVSLEQSEISVDFKASTRNVKGGETILFYAQISGGFTPYSYEWDFGDGSTSTSDSPTHAYKSVGDYTVTLKVTDDKGNADSQKRDSYIIVLPGWSGGNVVSSAWSGFLTFGRVVLNIIIWLVVFIPLWIVVGVILYFTWWRRRKKKA